MIPHPIGALGLVANMGATLLLLKFPPDLKGYRPDGSKADAVWMTAPTAAGKRLYENLRDGYQLALGLLFLGFFLQLLDLLRS